MSKNPEKVGNRSSFERVKEKLNSRTSRLLTRIGLILGFVVTGSGIANADAQESNGLEDRIDSARNSHIIEKNLVQDNSTWELESNPDLEASLSFLTPEEVLSKYTAFDGDDGDDIDPDFINETLIEDQDVLNQPYDQALGGHIIEGDNGEIRVYRPLVEQYTEVTKKFEVPGFGIVSFEKPTTWENLSEIQGVTLINQESLERFIAGLEGFWLEAYMSAFDVDETGAREMLANDEPITLNWTSDYRQSVIKGNIGSSELVQREMRPSQGMSIIFTPNFQVDTSDPNETYTPHKRIGTSFWHEVENSNNLRSSGYTWGYNVSENGKLTLVVELDLEYTPAEYFSITASNIITSRLGSIVPFLGENKRIFNLSPVWHTGNGTMPSSAVVIEESFGLFRDRAQEKNYLTEIAPFATPTPRSGE